MHTSTFEKPFCQDSSFSRQPQPFEGLSFKEYVLVMLLCYSNSSILSKSQYGLVVQVEKHYPQPNSVEALPNNIIFIEYPTFEYPTIFVLLGPTPV